MRRGLWMGRDFMNFVKVIIFFSVLIMHNAYALICVNSTSNYKMFGSVLRTDVLENPFIMAFNQERFTNYKIYHADNDTQLRDQIHIMAKEECSVILGLFTSQDCLVSGDILKSNKIIGMSSSCSSNDIIKFYPYLFTAVPQLSAFSKAVAEYINRADSGKVYVFYQPSDVYSNYSEKSFLKYIKKDIVPISVNSSGDFNYKEIRKIPYKKSTMVFFTYPLPSAQILVALDSAHLIEKNVDIIGASSWIFDVSVFRPIALSLKKANRVITPSLVSQKQLSRSEFTRIFFDTYKREPDLVEVLTYDMTRLSVECYNVAKTGTKFSDDY